MSGRRLLARLQLGTLYFVAFGSIGGLGFVSYLQRRGDVEPPTFRPIEGHQAVREYVAMNRHADVVAKLQARGYNTSQLSPPGPGARE
mmetsp:Transcript_13305/g.45124  ORF Transcript_13305/g.45124 Transcript_13305/m.45124 type:complete len:88 (-) Transcript_13305:871-1134(-)